jgi:hypothetical protein
MTRDINLMTPRSKMMAVEYEQSVLKPKAAFAEDIIDVR